MDQKPQAHSTSKLPDGYPSGWIETVRLDDGTQVLIRPIRPDDAARLKEGFLRLSPRSIYLRFLEPYKELSDKLAHQFAELDYHTRMALVAEIQEDSLTFLIGVARYACLEGTVPLKAESAVVVIDEYQQRGLGTILMNRLVRYALTIGIVAFLATIHHTNSQILHFLERSGLPTSRRMIEPGVWEVQIELTGDSNTGD